MRPLAALLLAAAAGCYDPTVSDGTLPCSSDQRCPVGLHCAWDNFCWHDGTGPDGGPDARTDAKIDANSDAAMTDAGPDLPLDAAPDQSLPDQSVDAAPDLASPDLRPPSTDLSAPHDLASDLPMVGPG